MKLQLAGTIRKALTRLAALTCLSIAASVLSAQTTTQPPPPQQATPPAQNPTATPAANDNPFPGESADVPIIPVDPDPATAKGSSSSQPTAEAESVSGSRPDPDGDPVRSPDAPGMNSDDQFSSSRVGLANSAAGPDVDSSPGKTAKVKTREQVVKDNLDVGEFYLEKKNWKAALVRFQDAFALDSESTDAIWGMAESERRMDIFDKAEEHYELFLSYDPEGPHGKSARKALDQLLRDHPQTQKAADATIVPHK